MPSSSSTPRTPGHSRNTSQAAGNDVHTPSSTSNNNNPRRLSSRASVSSPTTTTPQRHGLLSRSDSLSHNNNINNNDALGNGGAGPGAGMGAGGAPMPASANGGLGNLADELADAWDEDEDEDEDEGEDNEDDDGEREEHDDPSLREAPRSPPLLPPPSHVSAEDATTAAAVAGKEEAATAAAAAAARNGTKAGNMLLATPPVPGEGPGASRAASHRRKESDYDGSEYGDAEDLEASGLPAGLVARMDAVEELARRGAAELGTGEGGGGGSGSGGSGGGGGDAESGGDEVVKRVLEGLRELGSQSGVENGASRLITAHTALSSHLLHQTRLLQSLAHPLFSPLAAAPPAALVDELLPLLLGMGAAMPRPAAAAAAGLGQLHGLTADAVQALGQVSDSLHVARQATQAAARRLRSARELVAEMRREEAARAAGESWLARGNWSARLGARECAGVCGEVVGGFEEVCNGWRERLVAQAEAVGA